MTTDELFAELDKIKHTRMCSRCGKYYAIKCEGSGEDHRCYCGKCYCELGLCGWDHEEQK